MLNPQLSRLDLDEREQYLRYVEHLSHLPEEELARVAVPLLPERRSLSRDETRPLWQYLHDRWGVAVQEGRIHRQWYPLVAAPPTLGANSLLALEEPFWDGLEPLALRSILAARGIGTVYELRDWGPECVLDLALWEPDSCGADSYWTSDSTGDSARDNTGGQMDWLLYVSREETLTVAGEWFVRSVKEAWPEWEQHRCKRVPPRRCANG